MDPLQMLIVLKESFKASSIYPEMIEEAFQNLHLALTKVGNAELRYAELLRANNLLT